jgi:ABC-2 type transport system ATP-binding protein
VLRGLVRDGTTLVLTTQYLEEADQLCDDIVVIDRGKVIAAGTPTQLKDQAGAAAVVLTLTDAADLPRAEELLRTCTPEVYVEPASRRLTAQADGLHDMTRIGQVFADSGIAVDDLGLQRPSLDDVFLALTGHRAEDELPEEEKAPTDLHALEGAL